MASMAQAEALLKALGVDNEKDLNALSNYIFVEIERDSPMGWRATRRTRWHLSRGCRS